MKICPQCKMTYESNNLSTCANCGSQLVSWNDYNDDDKKTEETKYCPKCLNIESDPNAVFCKHCGEQLVEQKTRCGKLWGKVVRTVWMFSEARKCSR